MRELIIVLIGMCSGIIAGILILFALMGQKLRDQFFGRNLENKPIVIDWIDGHTKDFQIKMRGVTVFTGVIYMMTLNHDRMNGPRVHIEIGSKVEALRDFRS